MFEQLGNTYMAPSKYVKLKFVYGFDNSNSDYIFEIVLKNNGNRGLLSSLTVQTFLTGVLLDIFGPITRIQSLLIKWKFVSILYPKKSSKNLLKLPIRNLRGQFNGSTSFSRYFKVSLRFVGLSNSTSVSIHGIPDEVALLEAADGSYTSEEPKGSKSSVDTELLTALDDCEQIFLKAHVFKATYPAISVSYVHASRVIEKIAITGGAKRSSKKSVKNKGPIKRFKKTSKIVYRLPVIAMYLY